MSAITHPVCSLLPKCAGVLISNVNTECQFDIIIKDVDSVGHVTVFPKDPHREHILALRGIPSPQKPSVPASFSSFRAHRARRDEGLGESPTAKLHSLTAAAWKAAKGTLNIAHIIAQVGKDQVQA